MICGMSLTSDRGQMMNFQGHAANSWNPYITSVNVISNLLRYFVLLKRFKHKFI